MSTTNPTTLKSGSEFGCSGRVNSFCFTSDTRRVTLGSESWMRKWRDGDFIPNCFVESSYFIHVIRIHLHILVSNTISMSDDIRVVKQITRRVSYVDQELLTLFSGIHVARSLVFCIMLCRSLFVILAIAWSALRFPTSDYPFRILNFLFLQT